MKQWIAMLLLITCAVEGAVKDERRKRVLNTDIMGRPSISVPGTKIKYVSIQGLATFTENTEEKQSVQIGVHLWL